LPARVELAAPPPLRRRVELVLRDTKPGLDPEFPYAWSLKPEQIDALRHLFPEPLARAAVLVPLVDRPQGLQVLLTVRASHLKNHAGQISFPGGRIEPGDASAWEAATRETQEEIGLEPRYLTRVGYLRDHLVITGYRVTPVVAFVQPGFTLELDTTEVEEVFEVPLAFVLDPGNHVPRDRQLGGHTVISYDIPYEGHHIWGATANMLLTLGELLRNPRP
jgi:8-oxo-dGTP pyrophosphatase MutT (NUDIX family)